MVSQVNAQSLLHVCIAQMHHAWQYAQLIAFIKQIKALFFIQRIYVLDADTAFMHVLLELLNFHNLVILAQEVKWINVLSVQVDQKLICLITNSKSMEGIDLLKESYLYVQKCVLPKHS
jgi:Tfp pilus assembly protein PilZ